MTDSTMPPLDLDMMRGVLLNPNFKTYLVFGAASNKAWKLGQAAENFLPGVRAYLVKQDGDSQKTMRAELSLTPSNVGVVCTVKTTGTKKKVVVSKKLTKTAAEDFLKVCTAIRDA